MNRICRTCRRTIRRDEGCFEVPPHQDPDGPTPGFYCVSHAAIRSLGQNRLVTP